MNKESCFSKRLSLDELVKATIIGTESNQVRLGSTRYPLACIYIRELC
jgi:hypothetical protein